MQYYAFAFILIISSGLLLFTAVFPGAVPASVLTAGASFQMIGFGKHQVTVLVYVVIFSLFQHLFNILIGI